MNEISIFLMVLMRKADICWLACKKNLFWGVARLRSDVGAGSLAQSNTCHSTKSTQKWSWVNGYLQVTVGSGTRCLKVNSAIGTCYGPLLAWNKWQWLQSFLKSWEQNKNFEAGPLSLWNRTRSLKPVQPNNEKRKTRNDVGAMARRVLEQFLSSTLAFDDNIDKLR